MDVELLSKMVKELILDNDRVILPGMGAFQAEMIPASFSDRGYTINPPYRKLVFRTSNEQDTLLSDFYASANGIPGEVASDIIKEYVGTLAEAVRTQRTVVLPGLGKLRAARGENVFFIPDEDLDIYPAGMGLDPISLKSHIKPTSFDFAGLGLESVAATVPTKPSEPEAPQALEAPEESQTPAEPEVPETKPETPETEPETTEEPQEPEEPQAPAKPEVPETEPETPEEPQEPEEPQAPTEPEVPETKPETPQAPEPTRKSKGGAGRAILITLLVIILVAAILLAVFVALSRTAPEILDHILYTKEELEILNYGK